MSFSHQALMMRRQIDPYLDYVWALYFFDDLDGTTAPAPARQKSFVIQSNGTTGTDFVTRGGYPYGTPHRGLGCWRFYGQSTRGLILQAPSGGTVPFTLEFWCENINVGTTGDFFGIRADGVGRVFTLGTIGAVSSTLRFRGPSGTYRTLATVLYNNWFWVVIQRESDGKLAIYINGTRYYYSTTDSFTMSGSPNVYIEIGRDGNGGGGGSDCIGYYDDFRWTQGVARYSGDTIVDSVPLFVPY